jgi:hypothetical protein
MVGMGNLASNTLGIKDPSQAFDALMMMEQVEKKQMTQKSFNEKLKKMQEGNDPVVGRLDVINKTLSGQTEILRSINTNRMETLGKEAVVASNAITKADNEGIVGIKNVSGAINSTGAVEGAGNAAKNFGQKVNSGKFGGDLYNSLFPKRNKRRQDEATSDEAVINIAKKGRDENTSKGVSDDQIEKKVKESMAKQAKDIGKAIGENIKIPPSSVKTNVKVQSIDGKINDRTNR